MIFFGTSWVAWNNHLQSFWMREFGKYIVNSGQAQNFRARNWQFWLLPRNKEGELSKVGPALSYLGKLTTMWAVPSQFCLSILWILQLLLKLRLNFSAAGTFLSICWIQNVWDHSSCRPFIRWNCHSSSILFRATDIAVLYAQKMQMYFMSACSQQECLRIHVDQDLSSTP